MNRQPMGGGMLLLDPVVMDPKCLHYISLLIHLYVRSYVVGLVCDVVMSQSRVLHVHSRYVWETINKGRWGAPC